MSITRTELAELAPATDDQAALVELVRTFAREEVAPLVRENDENEQFPRRLLERMAELGLFGGLVSPEDGGAGLDHVTYSMVIEEMAKVDQIAAVFMSMPSSLVGAGLRRFGTPEQRERWLRPLAEGRMFGAAAVTEARSGSDVAGLTTTYRTDGDDFVLRGSKAWTSNLAHADFIVTFATRDRSAGRAGISAFVVPVGTPGLELRPYTNKMGFRAISTGDVFLDDIRVPRDHLIGEEGGGYAVAMCAVEAGRLAVASRCVGQAQAALDDAVAYAAEREVFGTTVASFQMTKAKLADMATGVVTSRLLTRAAAARLDAGERARAALSMAKQYASDVLQRVATDAVQIHGAAGTSSEHRVSRIYRDAKIFQLVEGANEIHRVLIAEEVLRSRLS